MHKLTFVLAAIVLLSLAGCAQMDALQITQDKPDNLKKLLQQHEYSRARQLTIKYPTLDTMDNHALITRLESAYEATTFAEARTLEANNDLLDAVNILSDALQKIPHSTLLRELRASIEMERVNQLQTNERAQLVSRANYMLEQQALYENTIELETPSITQRWENKRNGKEAVELAEKLLAHGKTAMEIDQLDNAERCLQLSNKLQYSTQTTALLHEISAIHTSRNQVEQKQANINKARKLQIVKRKQTNKTRQLLDEAQQALAANDLQKARAAIARIPQASKQRNDVVTLQQALKDAVDLQVSRLIVNGDALYRADDVLAAVRTWTTGLSLDPENQELRERVARANRVLAKLEQLKGQQPR